MKKTIVSVILLFVNLTVFAQDPAKNKTIPISVTYSESPAEITLNWFENNATGSGYNIYKKSINSSSWGYIGSGVIGTTTFTDNNIVVGQKYDYLVQKMASSGLVSWGYVRAGIKTDLEYNRGDFLILMTQLVSDSLQNEINQLKHDLYVEGWNVTTVAVNNTETVSDVKNTITQLYNSLPNLKSVLLLGHIPVPYSGNIYPDGHTNHEGAWSADVFYADIDGNWTDNSVNNTTASDSKNHNIPGDGKYDQSVIPSSLELQLSRVDFYDLTAFSVTEVELLRRYLNKSHQFKTAAYVPQERGLYDNGFLTMSEGFAQNAIRNFSTFFGAGNIDELDYFTTLSTNDYLWGYGCGGGSNVSVGQLNNGSAMTTTDLASTDLNVTFTMLFGSYFGDWDKTNNLMRAQLANGKTLSCSWAGRPNFHYHVMALGETLGAAAKLSMSTQLQSGFEDQYGGGFVHVAQLGDPSLRLYYLIQPTNLIVTFNNQNTVVDLNWTASTDINAEGYNVYRKIDTGIWEKLNSSIITSTNFTDTSIINNGQYEYLIKTVSLKINGSGSFYNESLGLLGTIDLLSLDLSKNITTYLTVYPNPVQNNLVFKTNQKGMLYLYNSQGQLVYTQLISKNKSQIDVSSFTKGVYLYKFNNASGKIIKQ